MTKDIHCFLHPLDDNGAILELVNSVQPQLAWSEDYLDWQCLKNPAGKARIWVAQHKKKIISTYMAIPHEFRIRDQPTIAWMVQDVMTHPDFRGLGIMHELANLCKDSISTKEFPLNYSFPNEFSYNSFIRRGWNKAFRVPLRVLENPSRNTFTGEYKDHSVEEVTSFSKRSDQLWNSAQTDFPFSVSRDSRYLSWRYLDKPHTKYFVFELREEERNRGLLIMKYFDLNPSQRVAHICDLFTESNNLAVVDRLLAHAIRFAQNQHVGKLTAWLPVGHQYETKYEKAGFVLNRSIDRWVVTQSHEDYTKTSGVEDPVQWHLSMGDSDVY